MMSKMEENVGKNLKSGFRKCGIHPLNREEPLKCLSNRVQEEEEMVRQNVTESSIEHLDKKKTELVSKKKTRKRRVNVPPGKSIREEDLPSTSGLNIPVPVEINKKPKKWSRKIYKPVDTSDESDAESVVYVESDDIWEEEEESDSEVQRGPDFTPFREDDKAIGSFVIVNYEGTYYPGMITKISEKGALIDVMEPVGQHWRWPANKDESWYENKEIICKMNAPRRRGKRGIFDVPEIIQFQSKK